MAASGGSASGDSDRWLRLQELFHEAAELAPEQRSAFLERRAGDDPELRARVEALLEAHERSSFLEPPEGLPGGGDEREADLLSEDALAGQRLGNYELLEEIGRGGAGVVYRARQPELEQIVAVKVLPALFSNPERRERFRREARAVARLDHPGIVRLLSFGEERGLCFYAMDWIQGHGLDAYLDARRTAGAAAPAAPFDAPDFRDPVVIAGFVRDVALALHHAHGRGIVHRDIKPQNLLVDAQGRPRLVDFGLAKDASLGTLTRTGALAGTPFYMSPEQAGSASARIDHRSDVYSLGAVLYELLTLHTPSSGDTLPAVLYSIQHDRPRPVRRWNPKAPRELALVCAKALRRRPDQRYASAAAFAEDLARFCRGEAVAATPPPLVERLERSFPTRRAVLRTAPAVLLAGAALGLGAGPLWRIVTARDARARVRAVLRGSDAELHVAVGVLAFDPAQPDQARSFHAAERMHGGAWGARLEPGTYRFVFATEDGRRAELVRNLHAGEELELTPRLVRPNEADPDSRFVPAGLQTLDLSVQPVDGGPYGYLAQVELSSFRIDAACVTNGAYARFAEESGVGFDALPAGLSKLFLAPPSAEWAALPVVGLTFEEARAYAEWHGKRLPTAAEWQRAAGGGDPGWLGSEQRARPQDFFTIARAVDRLGSEGRDLDYALQFLQPAWREQDLEGPYALCGLVGEVGERVATPPFALGPDGPRPYDNGSTWSMGYSWSDSAALLRNGLLRIPRLTSSGDRSAMVGLRCAWSADPLA